MKEKVKGFKVIIQNKTVEKNKAAVSLSPLYSTFSSNRIPGSGPGTDPTGIIKRT